ncbi:MAG TPA: DNRLRE domain-containing protein [Isosphaeraceae bacterium]|nr:DNRLRE domain-containing protein [Isosphaeraceae bacterium]
MDRARRIGWLGAACLACAVAWCPAASGTVIVLQPSPGAYESVAIDTTTNVQVKAHDKYLTHDWVKNSGDVFKEVALLQFDLSSVPAGQVLSAELTLNHAVNPADGAVFDIFRNTQAWSPGTVAWSTRPSVDPTPLSSITLSGGTGNSYQFDVTGAVNTWLSNPATDFGFSIERMDQTNSFAEFASGSALNAQAEWPTLTIALSPVPEPAGLLLLAAGGAGVLACARRRRAAGHPRERK